MRISIIGKGMEVSDYLREVAEKQAEKLSKYFNDDTQMQIIMSIQRNRHIVEVTIPYRGGTIRAAEATGDMYASMGAALKKIEKQVLKYRQKLAQDLKSGFDPAPVYEENDDEYEDNHEGRLVKTKMFTMKPMTVDEAIMQFELTGHPFYVFRNSASEQINVLYMRHDGDYGLIEPVD
ncbi:MAG: ribosome-associated translation inhibitor RaiA [Clostridia bacterium]|nr:ribosome-associated translation inhibitor RaiA [Clostridia bacterium]